MSNINSIISIWKKHKITYKVKGMEKFEILFQEVKGDLNAKCLSSW